MRATIKGKASGVTAPQAEATEPAQPVAAPEWESDLFLTCVLGAVLLAIFLLWQLF